MRAKPKRKLGGKERMSVLDGQNIYAKFYNDRSNRNSMVITSRSSNTSRRVTDIPKSFKCEICYTAFSSIRTLARHVEYYRNPKYPCAECGTKFGDTRQLEFHITYAHAETKKLEKYKLQCPVCNQMTVSKRLLQSHLYHYHSGWVEKNPDVFALKSKRGEKESKSDITIRGNGQENIETKMKKTRRRISRSEDAPSCIAPPGSASCQKTHNTSASSLSSKEDDGRAFVTIHESSIECEALLNETKVEARDNDVKNFRRNDENSIDFEALLNDSKMEACGTSENEKDEILRALHSCKECFVPLSRIPVSEKTMVTENLSEVKEIENPSEEMTQRQDRCNKFKAVSPEEICVDECITKSEPDAFVEPVPEFSETPNASSSSSLIDATTIVSKSTENQPSNTVISSKICNKVFTSKRAMQRHFRQRHMIVTVDMVYCVCGKPMAGRREKEKHFYQNCGQLTTMNVANPVSEIFSSCQALEKTYECKMCDEKFWLETCLMDHRRRCKSVKIGGSERRALTAQVQYQYRRLPRNSAQHVCTTCNSGFSTCKALDQHKQKYAINENHPCPICKTVFNGRRLLKGHIQSTHQSSRKHLYSIFCELCNQGFTKSLYKRIHIMHCHTIEDSEDTEVLVIDKSWPVPPKPIPAKKPAKSSLRTQSVPQIHNSLSLDNKCKVCNIVFVSRKRFIDHMIYYKKDEIMYCSICGEDFAGQYRAHNHNKKLHYAKEMQNSYTHRCTICQAGFMYKTHLQAHVSHVHTDLENMNFVDGNNEIPLKPNNCKTGLWNTLCTTKYTCNVCESSFPTSAMLSTHEMKYSNDGEFACNQCPRKCRTSAMLLDHISLNHSGDVILDGVKCSRCNENLLTRTAWVFHVKHFHNSEANEPSEFCFENNVSSSEEFGNVEIELIPTNESISSGMSYINFGNSINRSIVGGNPAEIFTMQGYQFGQSTSANIIERIGEKMWANCSTCGLACSGPAELAKHMALYSNTGHYNCTICGRRFTWRRFCKNHKNKHFLTEDNNPYFCPICDEGFKTITDMKMHEAHLHQVCRNIDETNGLPVTNFIENSPIEIKYDATEDKHNLQTEILEEELSLIYECPTCNEKYTTLDKLEEHFITVHKLNDSDQKPDDGPAKCITCKTVFVDKNLLRIHENNFHSRLIASESPIKQCCTVGNRFYILAGIEILPEDVDVLEKNFDRCNKRLGLSDCIYRYGPSYKCGICNIVFASKASLNTHQTCSHTVLSNAKIDNIFAEEQNSKVVQIFRKTYSASSRGTIPKKAFKPSSSFCVSSSQQNPEKPQRMAQSPNNTYLPTFTKSILKPVQTISDVPVKHYRCIFCHLIFVNKNLMRVHEVNGHCFKGTIERTDSDRPGKEKTCVSKYLEALESEESMQLLVSAERELNCDTHCERVTIPSASTNELGTSISKTRKNIELKTSLFSPNPSNMSPPRMRLINLPPGNYRIGKLKVRPFGKVVQNLATQTEGKRKIESFELAAKRVKKVFDPIAYRELCREYNLMPPSETPKKKSATKPLWEI